MSTHAIHSLLKQRILVLDGAMGTMIQPYKLTEADFRGERFKDWHKDLQGNNDLLQLTRPDVIGEIHRGYFEAGADIVETNTFNANAISMADYDMQALVREMNVAGARQAKGIVPTRPAFSLGAPIITHPADGIVEAVVVANGRARARAIAIRLEGLDRRWRATAIHVL